MVGDADFRPVTEACWDMSERVRDLDAMGIGQQIISQTPLLFQWHRDAETTAAVARDFNDSALQMVRERGAQGRLTTLCQVPLQDLDKACAEVSRAKKTGHVGVQIGNHLGARDLDDDRLVAFLRHCAEEDFPVLVHPWEMSEMGPGKRSKDFMMGWTVGMPMETHLSITRMILGGAFDRLPETLRICFAHGGGAFPALLGRLDNAWRERSIARGKAERPPREYMGRFYVDSAVFDAAVLRLLVETVGADRVMLGSDYPFPLGEQRIGHLVRTAPDLSRDHREAILWRNAEDFFGLAPLLPPVELAAETSESRPVARQKPAAAACNLGPHLLPPHLRWIGSPPPSMSTRSFGSTSFATPSRGGEPPFPGNARPASAVGDGRVQNVVDGRAAWPGRGLALADPATGEVRGEVASSSAEDVAAAVQAAKRAIAKDSPWARSSLDARCAALARLAGLLESAARAVAGAESRDTGKPLKLAESLDVPRSIANLRFFSSLAAHVGGEVHRMQGPLESLSYTLRKPVGVVGIVTPWNLPLYLLTWKLAPALAMGNSVVAKPSELTPTSATMLAEMCAEAGIPPGVVNVVHGEGHVAGQALVSHPDVAAVSFTGGTVTGATVATLVAPQFKKLSLELGGKNAAIVFDDCAFEDTVAGVLRSAFLNSGQICLCSSRVLVQRGRGGTFYHNFVAALVAAARRLVVGAPSRPTTDLGPLVSSAHLKKVQAAVERAQAEGGAVLCGGGPPEDLPMGFYFQPTVIAGLDMQSATAQTEIFGPVITVHPFDTEEEAVALANDSRYGLSASLWTESLARMELAERLHVGTVWVNTWLNRDLHMPFGGMRDSGVNREGGLHSLEFYSEATTVCVKRGARAALPMPGTAATSWTVMATTSAGSCSGTRHFSSLSPRNTPKSLGEYVYARRTGDLIFLSGIGPRKPDTDEVPGGPVIDPATGHVRDYDVAAQTQQCFANVRQVLKSVGCTLADVVDVQVFLVNMRRDFAAFNKVWAEEMGRFKATRTTIETTDLPPGGRIAVELKVVAQVQDANSL